MFVVQTISPPARRTRSVTTASVEGTNPCSTREPQVIGIPAIAIASFIADPQTREDAFGLARRPDAADPDDRVQRVGVAGRGLAGIADRLDGGGA